MNSAPEETCKQCGERFVNIGHPLKPGVIMQRICACVAEMHSSGPSSTVIITRPPTEKEREEFKKWSLREERAARRARGERPLRDDLKVGK